MPGISDLKEYFYRFTSQHHLIEDRFFSTGEYFTIPSNSSVNILIENSNSQPYFVSPQQVQNQRNLKIRKFFNVDFDSGTEITDDVVNKNSKQNREHDAKVYKNVSYSGGTEFNPKFSGGGASGISTGGNTSDTANLIAADDNMLIVLENLTSNENIASIDIDFVKPKDGEYVD
ncbi:MAG: hypothetical protein ACNS64_09250 [Candidatus Halalkalibacterium sp. M3_1C_030]